MKRFICIFVALLMVAGVAYAGAPPSPSSINVNYVSGHGEPGTPVQEVILVRYAKRYNGDPGNAPAIASGDVLAWDTISADGVTISVDILGYGYAGVAVTAILTPDTLLVDLTEDNWGYMCIRGFCLANVDTSLANTGYTLRASGNTVAGTFGTADLISGQAPGVSSADVGVLLTDNTADGLQPVWLR